jgi:hypothetical protein
MLRLPLPFLLLHLPFFLLLLSLPLLLPLLCLLLLLCLPGLPQLLRLQRLALRDARRIDRRETLGFEVPPHLILGEASC